MLPEAMEGNIPWWINSIAKQRAFCGTIIHTQLGKRNYCCQRENSYDEWNANEEIGGSRLDKQEFIKHMSALDIECMLLDDYLIDPNEIIVFSKKKHCLASKMQNEGIPSVICEQAKRRNIKIVTYSEMGISQWKSDLRRNGVQISQNITLLGEEDGIAFFLYYAFVFVQTPNWLKNNVLQELMRRLKVSCVEELEEWLAQYLERRNYKVDVKNIVILPPAIWKQLTLLRKCTFLLKQFRLKVFRKLTLSALKIRGVIHNRLTKERYIDSLRQTKAVGEKWCEINPNGVGSSGCTLIKEESDDSIFFIKGNELPIYEGLRNEITAQKRMLELAGKDDWFLPMIDCDSAFRWIRYQYVSWELLSRYKEKHCFTRSELDIFGEYLVTVLDNLYSMKLVHNDLRCENIFVRTKTDGALEGFVLTDFGCSSIEGSFPWKKETYWGKYLARGVCGKMRYNENIVDDAASALLVYLSVGGDSEDSVALKIKERIGRIFFVCE